MLRAELDAAPESGEASVKVFDTEPVRTR